MIRIQTLFDSIPKRVLPFGMSQKLRLYNTLTKTKEEFKPISPGVVKAYFCGPTVQDEPHIGHARAFIAFDTLIRYLKFLGYNVFFVRNITDIDDKIINKARMLGITPFEVAEKYMKEFFAISRELQLLPPNVEPRATCHIPEIIKLVQRLIEKGYAYITPDGVYYHVPKFKDYGKLSGQNIEKLQAGKRIEPSKYKKHPLDFALWKFAKPGEPYWDSPWGPGRPGWHIECSAMSMKYLGETFDIHGGGQDLIFPHHENEIAQSEAATGKKFAKYWFHVGLVKFKAEKMSKSVGNVVTVREVLKRYDPEVIKLWANQTHYRKMIEFSWDQLDKSEAFLDKLYAVIFRAEKIAEEKQDGPIGDVKNVLNEFIAKFKSAMNDDLNTPVAISVIKKMVQHLNKNMELFNRTQLLEFVQTVRKMGWVLGILQQSLEERITEKKKRKKDYTHLLPPGYISEERVKGEEFMQLLELIISVREELRRRKIYDLSDSIREKLREMGIILEDTKKGTIWKIID